MSSLTFDDYLATYGRLVYKSRGGSMLPLIREGRDLVVIEPADNNLRTYDVALYHRGSQYVLHRVIGKNDHEYLIRGDNCYAVEHVNPSQVIGVMTALVRNGTEISATDWRMKVYARVWHGLFPLRRLAYAAKRVARSMVGTYAKL